MPRWNLVIPDRTDRAVRTYLARAGGKKGDLSKFVDEAVRRQVLDLTVRGIKDRNAGHDQQELLDMVDEEVGAARAGRPRSEEHTSELQSLMRISYAVFCLKKKQL